MLLCAFASSSLTAMDTSFDSKPADGTVARQTSQTSLLRKTQSSDTITRSSSKPRGSYTSTTKSHAVQILFPVETQVKSTYFTTEPAQSQILESLQNIPWVKTKDVKVENNGENQSTTVTHFVDLSQLDQLYQREVLGKERPKIVTETRKSEQATLTTLQRNPIKSAFIFLAIGASLPYVVPMLLEKYNSLDK
jgi:hypothetical protein